MQNLMPQTIYGWIGLGAIVGTAVYHKSLGTVGLLAGFGLGLYLYFVVDQQSTPAS